MQEVDNILKIFEEAKKAISEGDVIKLKELSNQTIHTASTTQAPDNIAVAVMVYSISKIIERKEYRREKGWKEFYNAILSSINHSIILLKKKDEEGFKKEIENIRKLINKLSGDLKKDIQDVFRKASINKASKIYEHGVSMERTASLLGITMFELASYAGQKQAVSEEKEEKTIDVKSRIKTAMGVFER